MADIVQNISTQIESQFPNIYKENAQELIAFIEAYYEFLESDPQYSTNLSRKMFTLRDIDTTLDDFVVYFKEKYLKDFPFVSATDKRFLMKNVMDLYRSKGTERSINLLMNILFQENATEVYNPGIDVLRASDSIWYRPIYIEVLRTPLSPSLVGKQIRGSASGAKAFVEGLVTKRVNGKLIDILYLSEVQGTFRREELVTAGGSLENAPKIIGSLTNVTIELGGRENAVGDILNVISDQGKQGKVRITEVVEQTGRVSFEIVDGGYGYTNTSDATASDVYVATAMLEIDNADLNYIDFEPVVQRIETITTLSATDVNGASPGDFITGVDSLGVQVANGVIVSVANTDASGSVIETTSANSTIIVKTVGGTSFNDLRQLQVANATPFSDGEYVEEESVLDITFTSETGTFTNGDVVFQETRDAVANLVTSYAFGTIDTVANNVMSVSKAWGTFSDELKIVSQSNTAIEADVTLVSVTTQGARGQVASVDGANVNVRDIFGEFNANNDIRGTKTRLIVTVDNVIDSGATDIWLSGNNTANGVVDTVANNYTTGFIIGQNTSSIGIFGNTTPFYANSEVGLSVETNREELVSPPRNANGDIVEIESTIIDIKTGNNADFDIGFLENTETVTLNTDLVGGNNIASVAFTDVNLDGSNSGIGFVDSITINSGGTSYSNGSIVTFDAGGFAGGDPLVKAEGVIATDGVGAITSITMSTPGEGYYEEPTINLPVTGGTTANVSINMDFGYGFVAEPNADTSTTIANALTNENFTIGTIASLTRINPGENYNVDPFVRVRNKYIASYNRKDLVLSLSNVVGSFRVGEVVTQEIGPSTTAKGRVISFTLGDSGTGTLVMERNSFNVAFADSVSIIGSTTGSTADVDLVTQDDSSDPMGDNADITGTAINASGVATGLEVIDSGYGYVDGGEISLQREGFEYIVAGTANVVNQGVGEGYWKTTTSHLNSEKKIHDNKYYQEFSYDIQTGLSLDRYAELVKQVVHISGNAIFGTVVKRSEIDSRIAIANSSIETV